MQFTTSSRKPYAGIAGICGLIAERREVFSQMVLNALLENYGFLYKNDTCQLSPVFALQTLPLQKNYAFHAIGLANGNLSLSLQNILTNTSIFGLNTDEERDLVLYRHSLIKNNI